MINEEPSCCLTERTVIPASNCLKRAFDIAFSLSVMIFFFPLYLLIACLIRFTSKGKAIYYQNRIGKGGSTFRCYKFRTMHQNADTLLHDILESDSAKRKEWEKSHKLKDDPRITRIGIFLRKTSLDELPQFWNVLKGDLSVVGPRPVVQDEITRHFGPKAKEIFSIRPGITGLWQISGRNDTSYSTRIYLDEYYVRNRTFFMDLKIIALTISNMVTKKGAY